VRDRSSKFFKQTSPTTTRRTPNTTQINAELVKLATEVGVDAEALNARLAITKGGNSGSATTQAGRFVVVYDWREASAPRRFAWLLMGCVN
jgi:hypothetical protein